jgi:hypothetical protein
MNWIFRLGHSVKAPNAKPKVQTFGHELPRPLDHSLSFHSYPTQTSLQEFVALVKKEKKKIVM